MKKTSYMQVYAIHDKKAKTFETPFTLPNNAYAVRSFQDAVNNANTPYAKYAKDFELCRIGEYDQETGTISAVKTEVLVQASDLKAEQAEKTK